MIRFATAAASYRATSEDRFVVLRTPAGWIMCVADGVSGTPGGGKAADRFVECVRRVALQRDSDASDPIAWAMHLGDIDSEIARDPMAGETTGIALGIVGDRIAGASCGDSRAYLLSRHGPRELTSEQARKPRLGTGRARPCAFSVEARGVLVLGTDGLFDYADPNDMFEVVRVPSDNGAEALVRLVRHRHRVLPDDVAVVVAWLGE
ncbi:protein phosphatase 2C domain-containing protein [Pendulispora rubella]|uniref:Protein phosphatase 2C domain-containing protein n=1 Tax=Pendulispora rubella TaxID=2741070 RepID=A0ABZ2L0N2_9BACT